ncbi:FtsJ-like methyltransferase-domain-containing protein [Phyllosticta capitalensis]|uniref:FtsJ-like methyltransferase-domain-containing protein n=1 Tax=Phyllosticta capitalensis TaxID=121624 RepID=UPI00312DE671
MLSMRFIRRLIDSTLLDRPITPISLSPCCRRLHNRLALRPIPHHGARSLSVASPPPPFGSPCSISPRPQSPLLPRPQFLNRQHVRHKSSKSSGAWTRRQGRDTFTREAKVQGLKSRAAFKLLEINEKYRIFRRRATVVDLGYAPGSWSQVAISCTAPGGRVIGIDVIPAQPPRGVSTIQGNFLSPAVQAEVRAYVQDPARGRAIERRSMVREESGGEGDGEEEGGSGGGATLEELEEAERGYIDRERRASLIAQEENVVDSGDDAGQDAAAKAAAKEAAARVASQKAQDVKAGRVVDVVLSDMCEPWELTSGFHKKSVTEPYFRMMNTSGIPFRDHAGSMDLCNAALNFAHDTLRSGGHFVCKFYQGAEDKELEKALKRLFERVHRLKPEASRDESNEAYFVALRRKAAPTKDEVFGHAPITTTTKAAETASGGKGAKSARKSGRKKKGEQKESSEKSEASVGEVDSAA